MTPHLLVLTANADVHADHVLPLVRDAGVRVSILDPGDLPATQGLTVRVAPDGTARRIVHTRDGQVDLVDVTAVWYRKPLRPGAAGDVDRDPVARHVATQNQRLSDDVWAGLDVPVFPAPRDQLLVGGRKLPQLATAAQLGFTLPDTLVSTNPDELLDFWDVHRGRVISKALDSPSVRLTTDGLTRMAEPVTPLDIAAAASLRLAPVIVQAYVPKDVELRVTVVGRQVFAAAIHSQISHHTAVDWRCYDGATTPFSPHELPADLRQRCIDLVEVLGLGYGAIDLVRTPDGEHVFLEINPNGQWLWIEEATGLPISAAVAARLVALAETQFPVDPTREPTAIGALP